MVNPADLPETCGPLRDAIGYQLVFDLYNPVTQVQFTLLQARAAKLVMATRFDQSGNGLIQITMFDFEQFKSLPQLLIGYRHVGPIPPLHDCNKFVIFILFMVLV